ncbi:MAG: response regulator transcription factor [Atopobiaceae bacterium]|nr:response regulator transcription factor [Atopobiaceae bacterium]
MAKTRVMIVDDQHMARQYFELLVAASDRYEVVDRVESATFADTYVLRGRVDLVLLDVLMSDGSSSFDAAERIKRLAPQVKVIMVTSIPEASWMDEARERNVDGFWYKESEAQTILSVMDRVMAGERVYPKAAPATMVGAVSSADLTQREVQILRALVDGLTNEEMAERLCLAPSTVKTHMRHLLEKTGLENRTQLALQARLSGLVVGKAELGLP